MSGLNNKDINDLLRQYRDGSISDKDRHHLELLALDDPFLFDSLEGYVSAEPSSHINTESIKRKVQPESGKVINMRYLSIAAGMAILLGGLFWVNSQLSETTNQDFSQVTTEEKCNQIIQLRLIPV